MSQNPNKSLPIAEIARFFSLGHFSKVYPYLHEEAVWIVIGENCFSGKEAIIANCEQVAAYFDSVTTHFNLQTCIAEGNHVAIQGTAQFYRAGKLLSEIAACDVYQFSVDSQIVSINSYCISSAK